MATLRFPNHRSFIKLLADGALPASVQGAKASAGTDEAGRIWLQVKGALSKRAVNALSQRRIDLAEAADAPALRRLGWWPEAVPLVPWAMTSADVQRRVRIETPTAHLPRLVSELAGRDWQLDFSGPAVRLAVTSPPLSCVLRLIDDADSAVFVEHKPRVWMAGGWRHPCLEQIDVADDAALYLQPDMPWAIEPLTSAEPVPAVIALKSAVPGKSRRLPTRIPVGLRWLPERFPESASLWILTGEPLRRLGMLIRDLDQAVLQRLQWASTSIEGQLIALLKVADNQRALPYFADIAAAYRPLQRLDNLFVPHHLRLTPTPRRDRAREILAPDPGRLYWLDAEPGTLLQPKSIPLAAFRPLLEAVRFIVAEAPVVHDSTVPENLFALNRFAERQAIALKSAIPSARLHTERPESAAHEDSRNRGWLSRAFNWLAGDRARPHSEQSAEGEPPHEEPVERQVDPPARLREIHLRVQQLEKQFIGRITSSAAPDRALLWAELADAYTRTENATEAALCWLNAAWDESPIDRQTSWSWLKAEASQARWNADSNADGHWLEAPPAPARARAVAAFIVWAVGQEPRQEHVLNRLKEYQEYLDRNEHHLPLKAAWLARSALTGLSRGDLLALTRTRDTLGERLYRNGLSLDRDLPTFLRFVESDSPDRFAGVGKWLLDKRAALRQWIGQLHPERTAAVPLTPIAEFGLEAEVPCTQAYADLMIAWGLARLGEKSDCQRVREEAFAVLDGNDPVHAFLRSAFDYRIAQAREGQPADGPFAVELLTKLDTLTVDDRYRVDRLREDSRILDPGQGVNAYWASTFRDYAGWDQLRRQLIELPGLDTAELNQRVQALLARSTERSAMLLPVILNDVLDSIARLDSPLISRTFELLPATLDRLADRSDRYLALLEKSMLAAATVNRPDALQSLTQRFGDYVESQRSPLAASQWEGLTGQSFRCLRRLGLKSEAERLLGRISDRLTDRESFAQLRTRLGPQWPRVLHTLLHVAAGWYYCGRDVEGHRIIDDARLDLYQGQMPVRERTAMAMSYAATLGHIPVRLALSRFDELFQRLKKVSVNGWNSHYTLQPLKLIDTVIRSLVNEDFTLGPGVRGWLDDEEYRVRGRLAREVGDLMRQQNVS